MTACGPAEHIFLAVSTLEKLDRHQPQDGLFGDDDDEFDRPNLKYRAPGESRRSYELHSSRSFIHKTSPIGCCHSPWTDNWPTPGVHLLTNGLFVYHRSFSLSLVLFHYEDIFSFKLNSLENGKLTAVLWNFCGFWWNVTPSIHFYKMLDLVTR